MHQLAQGTTLLHPPLAESEIKQKAWEMLPSLTSIWITDPEDFLLSRHKQDEVPMVHWLLSLQFGMSGFKIRFFSALFPQIHCTKIAVINISYRLIIHRANYLVC